MKLKLFLLCALSSVFSMQAQKNAALSGKVTDKNNAPISYANIVLKLDGKIATGGITGDDGQYEIKNLEPKNYQVEIQFIGYKTFVTRADFTTGQKSISLGRTTLEEEATTLGEVAVIAERSTIEQKIDRKVINVGKDLTTAGATASEIMNNIPSVNVDQDGKLSLRGNENVRVLIDGKPTNIDASQLLKQIPSTSIKKIELITNPSAKYNPEGMSGIINIVLHKNANDGFNASVNAGATFARTPKANGSFDMNYRRGKVNFFGNYGTNFGNQFNAGHFTRTDSIFDTRINMTNANMNQLFKVGLDFYLNDRNTISVYTNQNFFDGTGLIDSYYMFADVSTNVATYDKYLTDNVNSAYNIAYKHLFGKEGHTLDVEANYSVTGNDKKIFFKTDATPYILSDATLNRWDFIYDDREQTIVNVDYVNPLSNKSTLELGAESRTIRTDNEFASLRTAGFNYTYDLDIYSAYATFGQKFEKISYQLGARLESYSVLAKLDGATAYKDDYLTVYPSAYVTYTPSQKNNFQLSYSRRVDRPSLEQTKPSPEFATLKLTSIGNPELDPQFTNSVELNYTRTLSKGSITGGVFFRLINDEISRVLYPDPERDGNQIMSFQNYDNNNAYGFELSANYKITSWWDVQPSVDFSAINQKGQVTVKRPGTINEFDVVIKDVTANAFNGRMNHNFKASKTLRFNLFGFYRGAVEGVQFTGREMYKMDAGVRYSMLKNKGSLSVRFNDVFNTMRFAFVGDNPYPQTGSFKWESQSIYVGFNYMFGAGKNRALQRKQRDDNTKQNSGGLF